MDDNGMTPGDYLTGAIFVPAAGRVQREARQGAARRRARRRPFWRSTLGEFVVDLVVMQLGISAFLVWSGEGHLWAAYGVALPGILAAVGGMGWLVLRTLRR